MSRPAQVERQIERVKEIEAEMLEGEKPPVEPNQQAVTPDTSPSEPVTPTVTNDVPVTISKEEYDKLEQRYRTLQGMHQAEGNRYRSELASLQAAVQDLEDRLAENTNTVSDFVPSRYVTDADEEEYGDTLEAMRRAAKEEAEAVVANQIKTHLERIAQLESRVGQFQNTVVPTIEDMRRSQQAQVESDFWSALSVQVPDWNTINSDPKFHEWLLAEDPVTGANRQQFLRAARNNFDAPRVIKFFQEWKRTQAGGPTPAPNHANQSELERLIGPGASKGNSVPITQQKKQWTRAEISAFFADVVKGKYIGRAEEQKKIEADIVAAGNEGRVS